MSSVKVVHLGGVDSSESTIQEFLSESRVGVIYKINVWLVDYCKRVKQPVSQLPPLDDWTRSKTDRNMWEYELKDIEFSVWIKEGRAVLPK